MKIKRTYLINVPHVEEPITMTGAELEQFHDELTKFINDHWTDLKAEREEIEQLEDKM